MKTRSCEDTIAQLASNNDGSCPSHCLYSCIVPGSSLLYVAFRLKYLETSLSRNQQESPIRASNRPTRRFLHYLLRDLASKHQPLERRLVQKIHTQPSLLDPHPLHHRIIRITKLVTPFVVWVVRKCSISVPVRELPFLYGVCGLDGRVADSKTGDFEPVDGRDRVVVAHGVSDLDLDGRVAEAVVCEDLVGEFLGSFLLRRWVGGGGVLHFWAAAVLMGVVGLVTLCWLGRL
jgi:hypothetical protein